MNVVLAVGCAILGLAAWLTFRRCGNLELLLESERRDLRDESTGLFTRAALHPAMHPELEWARVRGVPATLLRVDVFCMEPAAAGRRFAAAVRREEPAAMWAANSFTVLLLETAGQAVDVALTRLCGAVRSTDTRSIDAGFATFPNDGVTLDELLDTAGSRMAPF